MHVHNSHILCCKCIQMECSRITINSIQLTVKYLTPVLHIITFNILGLNPTSLIALVWRSKGRYRGSACSTAWKFCGQCHCLQLCQWICSRHLEIYGTVEFLLPHIQAAGLSWNYPAPCWYFLQASLQGCCYKCWAPPFVSFLPFCIVSSLLGGTSWRTQKNIHFFLIKFMTSCVEVLLN